MGEVNPFTSRKGGFPRGDSTDRNKRKENGRKSGGKEFHPGRLVTRRIEDNAAPSGSCRAEYQGRVVATRRYLAGRLFTAERSRIVTVSFGAPECETSMA